MLGGRKDETGPSGHAVSPLLLFAVAVIEGDAPDRALDQFDALARHALGPPAAGGCCGSPRAAGRASRGRPRGQSVSSVASRATGRSIDRPPDLPPPPRSATGQRKPLKRLLVQHMQVIGHQTRRMAHSPRAARQSNQTHQSFVLCLAAAGLHGRGLRGSAPAWGDFRPPLHLAPRGGHAALCARAQT